MFAQGSVEDFPVVVGNMIIYFKGTRNIFGSFGDKFEGTRDIYLWRGTLGKPKNAGLRGRLPIILPSSPGHFFSFFSSPVQLVLNFAWLPRYITPFTRKNNF